MQREIKSEVWASNFNGSSGMLYAIALCYLTTGKCTVHWKDKTQSKVRVPLQSRIIERIRAEFPEEYLVAEQA